MDSYVKWVQVSQQQAQIATSKGISPNEYEPYMQAQQKCRELFDRPKKKSSKRTN